MPSSYGSALGGVTVAQRGDGTEPQVDDAVDGLRPRHVLTLPMPASHGASPGPAARLPALSPTSMKELSAHPHRQSGRSCRYRRMRRRRSPRFRRMRRRRQHEHHGSERRQRRVRLDAAQPERLRLAGQRGVQGGQRQDRGPDGAAVESRPERPRQDHGAADPDRQRGLRQLSAITPPSDLQSDYDAYLANGKTQIGVAQQITSAAKSGDTSQLKALAQKLSAGNDQGTPRRRRSASTSAPRTSHRRGSRRRTGAFLPAA